MKISETFVIPVRDPYPFEIELVIPSWLGLGGLTIALLAVSFSVFCSWVTKVILGVRVGNRIVNGPEWIPRKQLLALSVGLVIFVLLNALPFVGNLIGLVAMLIGIGSTAIWIMAARTTLSSVQREI